MEQTLLNKPLDNLVKRLDWEKTLYIVIIIIALFTRLWGLGERVQSHDESIHARYSWNLYSGRGFQHHPLMHGPTLFHVTALSFFVLGDNDFTARLPVALMGVAMVAFPYFLRRWLGRPGALAASFFLLISPSIAYYSRYIRHDIPLAFLSLIVVLAIFRYLHDGRERWLYLLAAGVALTSATFEAAFIYLAIFGFFLIGLFAVQALGREWSLEDLKPLSLIALAVMMVGLTILGCGILLKQEDQAISWWAISGGLLAGLALLAATALLLVGTWRNLRDYRVFDLIILLGTLCLPFLSPLPIKLAGLDPMDYTSPTIYYSGATTIAMLCLSAGIGLAWNWRRWSVAAAIHYGISVVFFTTFFTNGYGLASGWIGSMGYWLAQQGVRRGGQPWYYYAVTVSLYEYLPFLLALIASIYFAVRSLIRRSSFAVRHSPFVPFLLWWVVFAWLIFSYAGEKMPWLTAHIALPMILLSGWLIGLLLETVDWKQVWQHRAWLLALVAPPFVMALGMLVRAAATAPFRGRDLTQLHTTGLFIGALIGVLGFGAGLAYLVWRSRWGVAARILLLVALLLPVALTVRTAWRFCTINDEYPTELLVYAHAAPAVSDVMRQIEELSRRTTGTPNLIQITCDAASDPNPSTLMYWQLRNFPNAVFYYDSQPSREQMEAPVIIAAPAQWETVSRYVGNNYLATTYTYLWWPMQDYFGLTWERIRNAITNPPMRAALWDIWYNRDYARYDAATGTQHALDKWPLHSEFRLYIRRDVAAQMWELSTTEAQPVVSTDPYAEGWQERAARLVFGSAGAAPGQFQAPRGIKVAPDGFVYVADSGNSRIQKFTADGEFVASWGRESDVGNEVGSPQGFKQPWDVAVAPDGSIYVADTWNHRIQELGAAGDLLTAWGLFGQYGPGSAAGQGAFYGPRGIAVGPAGRVYVADTGNKRIQVFEPDGRFAFEWGGGGVAEGYLDEPVGIAVGPGDEVYVADTWNQRVQVFDAHGVFLRQWPISGWDTGNADEKPYLAVDSAGTVYVTDPGHCRVLVFDRQGNYVLSFGQYGADERSFAWPEGIAVSENGSIYVTDANSNRVLVFDPPELAAGLGGEISAPTLEHPAEGEELPAGRVALDGSGNPLSRVQILIDGESVGVTGVNNNGVWTYATELDEPGAHEIVVQALDASGNVVAASHPVVLTITTQ